MTTNAFFFNITNHPSGLWSDGQLAAARAYGEVVDQPFPVVDETCDEMDVARLAGEYVDKLYALSGGQHFVVHVMGEMTLTFALVTRLKALSVRCLASTTCRDVALLPDGTKQVSFHFCRFRVY